VSATYGLIGNPVAHSRSPSIHAAFALQTGQEMLYRTHLLALHGFDQGLNALRANPEFLGCNVTMPFKLDALHYAARGAGQISRRAQLAGAANTLKFEAGLVMADNTDGVGLVSDIETRVGLALAGSRVLVIGAGGATRGIALPLLEAGAEKLCIANRTLSKAEDIVQAFVSGGLAPALSARIGTSSLDRIDMDAFDVIINATPYLNSLDANPANAFDALGKPPSPLKRAPRLAYDLSYAATPSAFLRWAQELGCEQSVDGLGMLVNQAAESFWFWRGIRPETETIYAQQRLELQTTVPTVSITA
jgi:shikimate dehydrogenase